MTICSCFAILSVLTESQVERKEQKYVYYAEQAPWLSLGRIIVTKKMFTSKHNSVAFDVTIV